MKSATKKWLGILLALTLVVTAGYALVYFGFGIDLFSPGGWKTSRDGSVRYLDEEGEPLTSWQNVDSAWYYFDPDNGGNMVTGWLTLPEGRYYLASNGKRQEGFQHLEDGIYYMEPSTGLSVTGWINVEGDIYYLDEDGRVCTGWTDVNSLRYCFGEGGAMITGWLIQEDRVYYLDGTSGVMATGLTEVDGLRYYFGEDGVRCTGWTKTEEGIYCLDENSGVVLTGWVESEGGLCYLKEDTGIMATGWTDTDTGRYYFSDSGYICTGWTETEDGTYYLDDGGHPVSGWMDTEDGRCYLDGDGRMAQGWLTLEDTTYYFEDDGTMAVGKVIIDGEARYFASNGAYVVMVNGWNPVPQDYTTNLVYFGSWQVSEVCYDALDRMLKDCPYSYTITSAYRSKDSQQSIWTTRLYNYLNSGYSEAGALALVKAYVAKPGYSEHQLGLAIDIAGSDAVCGWLAEHCWEYGFILRYPEGKSDITGIAYERWHFRYLGTALSTEIRDLGVTLEEYMDMLTAEAGSDAGTASDPERFDSCWENNAA